MVLPSRYVTSWASSPVKFNTVCVPWPSSPPGRARIPRGSRMSPNPNGDPHVALEALPGLPDSGTPAIDLHEREPFDLGSYCSIHASKSSRSQATTPRLKTSTFSSDIAPAVSLGGVLLSMQSGSRAPPRAAPASREKQQRPAQPRPGRTPALRILAGDGFGRYALARESPALRGFHGPGRTRTCVLRIMSYVPGVEPWCAETVFRAWKCPNVL